MRDKIVLMIISVMGFACWSQTKAPITTGNTTKWVTADNLEVNALKEVKNGVTFVPNFKKSVTSKNGLTTTAIPDANFEQALIDLGIDSDGTINQQILTADAEAVLELDVANRNISDLTGIEAFVNLTLFYCWGNQLTTLDVTSNTNLEDLSCARNQLSSIDVTPLLNLKTLVCHTNQFQNLDVSQNAFLEELYCEYNQITNLDLSNNIVLNMVFCSNNRLITLDVTNNNGLIKLFCNNNQLSAINLGSQPNLSDFNCNDNQLANISLSGVSSLRQFLCYNNNLTTLDLSNTNVGNLQCYNNQLTALDLSASSDLVVLFCHNNQLTSLDLTNNTQLNNFSCANNQLNNLVLPNTGALVNIFCGNNQISSLNVSNNPSLRQLWCYQNQLGAINTTNNTNLEYLVAWDNEITSFDVSQNTKLIMFQPGRNPITQLDLSFNITLRNLFCAETDITNLNLANGNNTIINNGPFGNGFVNSDGSPTLNTIYIANNPNLFCVKVDDITYSQDNWTNKDYHTTYSLDCGADDDGDGVINSHDKCANTPMGEVVDTQGCTDEQLIADDDNDGVINFDDKCPNTPEGSDVDEKGCKIIVIPDANFEQALIDLGIDTDGEINQQVTAIDVENVTNLDVRNKGIGSLKGIEGFESLIVLRCESNELTELDISKNLMLADLRGYYNNLSTIDISQNINLEIAQLDGNSLETIDVSKNLALKSLTLSSNNITSSIDVSQLVNLERLDIKNNPLLEVNVSSNINLRDLFVDRTNIQELDLSKNVNLERIHCFTTLLASLNVKNGNNTKIIDFRASNNPLLDCIDVDDVVYSKANWSIVDSDIVFSLDCSALDDDEDGIANTNDNCPDTSTGEAVDASGCSESQKDDDEDGVTNNLDQCTNTPSGEAVDTNGCSESQKDDDNDGVMNDKDTCANTPSGEAVDTNGCSESQKDDDNDGVMNDKDQCPNTGANINVNTTGCISVASSNFNIQTIGETCPDKDNAQIVISTNETHNYVASFNGIDYPFTSNLTIENIAPGTSNLCISIPAELYEQCFSVTLEEGEAISGKTVSTKPGKVSVSIEKGTAPYFVSKNNEVYLTTSLNTFEVVASHGDVIEISTSKSCEGKLSKVVDISSDIFAYPNPTSGDFEITLPILDKEILLEVYTIHSQLLLSKKYNTRNGKIEIDFDEHPNGVYFIKAYLDEPTIIKLIKN